MSPWRAFVGQTLAPAVRVNEAARLIAQDPGEASSAPGLIACERPSAAARSRLEVRGRVRDASTSSGSTPQRLQAGAGRRSDRSHVAARGAHRDRPAGRGRSPAAEFRSVHALGRRALRGAGRRDPARHEPARRGRRSRRGRRHHRRRRAHPGGGRRSRDHGRRGRHRADPRRGAHRSLLEGRPTDDRHDAGDSARLLGRQPVRGTQPPDPARRREPAQGRLLQGRDAALGAGRGASSSRGHRSPTSPFSIPCRCRWNGRGPRF